MNVNLLPWRETRYQQRLTCFYSAFVFGLLLLLSTSSLAHYGVMASNQRQRLNNHQIALKITILQSKLGSLQTLETIKSRITLLHDIARQNQQSVDTPRKVSRALPIHAYLTQLDVHPPVLLLQGHADNTQTVAAFIQRLHRISTLKKVTLRKITQRNDSTYSIQAQLRTIKPS